MRKELKGFLKFLGIIIIIGLIYTGGYFVGHKNLQLEKGYIPKITNFIIKYKDKDLGKALLSAMRSNQSPDMIPCLSAVVEKGTYEMKLGACANSPISGLRSRLRR